MKARDSVSTETTTEAMALKTMKTLCSLKISEPTSLPGGR